jgi:hypothetical protein
MKFLRPQLWGLFLFAWLECGAGGVGFAGDVVAGGSMRGAHSPPEVLAVQ